MTRRWALILLVQHRGVDRRWMSWGVVAWAAAVASARVGIPPVSASTSSATEALEQLGAMGTCLPVILVAVLVRDRSRWLTDSSPRNRRVLRLTATFLVSTIGLISAVIAAPLYPSDVRRVRVVSLFCLILALTVLMGAVVDGVWAALPGPVLVAVATVPSIVPWRWNIVYNPATDGMLTTTAAVALGVAFAVSFLVTRGSET